MDENLASAYNEVGVGYMMNKMYAEGKEAFLKSLHSYRSLENYSMIMTGFPSANLGLAHMHLGQLDEATKVLHAALRDQEDIFGQNDTESEKYGAHLNVLFSVLINKQNREDFARSWRCTRKARPAGTELRVPRESLRTI